MLRRLFHASASMLVLALAMTPGFPSAAVANLPSAALSTKPLCIKLVGDDGTVADPAGAFEIVVRSLTNNTIANSNVVLDFSACTETHIANQASQKFAGMTVTPVGKKVSAITNSVGVASFDIEGGIDPALGAAPLLCIVVSADNVLLGTITATAINENVTLGVGSSNPVNSADASTMIQRQLPVPQPYKASSDLTCDGAMNAADISVLLSLLLGPPINGNSTVCPNPTTGYAW